MYKNADVSTFKEQLFLPAESFVQIVDEVEKLWAINEAVSIRVNL